MKDKIFGILQRVGRSFMLPIAILPVAGLLLGKNGFAGNRRIFYERNNVGNLRSAGRYGTGNRTESDPAGYERCR